MKNKVKPYFNKFNRMLAYFIWLCGCGGTMCGIYGIITDNFIINWIVLFCGIVNLSYGLFNITYNKFTRELERELECINIDIKYLEKVVKDVKNS